MSLTGSDGAQPPAPAALRRRSVCLGELCVGLLDLTQEPPSVFGELHAPAGTGEELAAGGLLQRGDGLTDGRGAAVQAHGRATEVELLGHGEKALQVGEVHGRALRPDRSA
ncbi:hypothetical protein GCM10020295_01080 [Streptomyces cinereospinus]